ncbi:MAG: helix-hairpin-helix domain-containing protein [Campylobacteraceae bacterium]|jgi:competence protein ComEA|nr:helix-hairpin-helix domain-containing protein [Campylobacteraceae bacterium]
MKKILFMLVFLVVSLFAKIDINNADVKTLSSIKGLGEKKAEAIIDYRDKNGKFKSVDELLNVKGIGKKLLEKITEEVEVK